MNAALPDLDKVVELKSDFISGRLQRGNIYYKMGSLDRASDDYKFAVSFSNFIYPVFLYNGGLL